MYKPLLLFLEVSSSKLKLLDEFERILFELLLHFRMLDDFGTELENTESKLDSTMKKVAKVLHISNGKHNCFVEKCSTTTKDLVVQVYCIIM